MTTLAQHSASTSVRDYELSKVQVVQFNATPGTRLIMRDVLHNLGFRALEDVPRVDRLRTTTARLSPDFLVLEIQEDDEEICEIVTDIRHGRLGNNPYTVILLVTWRPHEPTINKALQAGADDIVTLPLSTGLLSERIDNLIRNRKDFVATANYLGPDRRKKERRSGDSVGTFAVPNNMRFKATGDLEAAADANSVKQAQDKIENHRRQRLMARFDAVAEELEEYVKERTHRVLPDQKVTQLADLVQKAVAELDTLIHHNTAELAQSIHRLMDMIRQPTAPAPSVFALLRVHGQAVNAAFHDSDDAPDLMVLALQRATAIIGDKSKKRSS